METNKVFAKAASGEALTGDQEFFTLNTLNAVAEGSVNFSTASAVNNLARILEIAGIKAQPVVVGVRSFAAVDLQQATNRTLYGFGTGYNAVAFASVTVYQVKLAFERSGLFGSLTEAVDSTVAGSLAKILADETAALALPYTTAVGTGPVNMNTLTFTGTSNTASLTATSVL